MLSFSVFFRDVFVSIWALGSAVVVMILASFYWRLGLELSGPRVLLVILTPVYGIVRPWVIVSISRWSRCPFGSCSGCQGFVATRSWSVLCPDVMGVMLWGL